MWFGVAKFTKIGLHFVSTGERGYPSREAAHLAAKTVQSAWPLTEVMDPIEAESYHDAQNMALNMRLLPKITFPSK